MLPKRGHMRPRAPPSTCVGIERLTRHGVDAPYGRVDATAPRRRRMPSPRQSRRRDRQIRGREQEWRTRSARVLIGTTACRRQVEPKPAHDGLRPGSVDAPPRPRGCVKNSPRQHYVDAGLIRSPRSALSIARRLRSGSGHALHRARRRRPRKPMPTSAVPNRIRAGGSGTLPEMAQLPPFGPAAEGCGPAINPAESCFCQRSTCRNMTLSENAIVKELRQCEVAHPVLGHRDESLYPRGTKIEIPSPVDVSRSPATLLSPVVYIKAQTFESHEVSGAVIHIEVSAGAPH